MLKILNTLADGLAGCRVLTTHMTNYINRRVGKLLFPHLARDQRNHQLLIILLVLAASFSAAIPLTMWMMSGRH